MISKRPNNTSYLLALFILLLSGVKSLAQSDTLHDDSEVSGYWRNYLMLTNNQHPFQDWSTVSTGGKLLFKTKTIKGFRAGMGFYTSINSRIGNVQIPDPKTGKVSRYELGNYNVENTSQREIAYLGELYFNYLSGSHQLTLGRQLLKSPLLNPEDGRMIPTLVQGMIYTYSKPKSLQVNLGWLSHIAPRSSDGFYTVAESIGIYPTGLNTDGTPSGYRRNLQSKGIGIASFTYRTKNFNVKLWEYFTENIFNSIYVESHISGEIAHIPVDFGTQLILQKKINTGGNALERETYFSDDRSFTWGLQLNSHIAPETVLSLNYNRISDEGRFLFPREWGREPLFTFQKRERLEGTSDVHAWMLKLSRNVNFENGSMLDIILGYGQYYLQEPTDFEFNKYAMPSRWQGNLDIFYQFTGKLKGWKLEYLLAWKKGLGSVPNNPNFILNKVEMQNHNVILNYSW